MALAGQNKAAKAYNAMQRDRAIQPYTFANAVQYQTRKSSIKAAKRGSGKPLTEQQKKTILVGLTS